MNDKPDATGEPGANPDADDTELMPAVGEPVDQDALPTQVMPIQEKAEPPVEKAPPPAESPPADGIEVTPPVDETGAADETPPAGEVDDPPPADETEAAAAEVSEEEPAAVPPAPPAGVSQAWQRLRAGLRPSRGQAIVGAVLGLVAFLAVVQVRLNLADDGYANARREDLITILDGLGQSTRRLESEIADLQQRKGSLSSGADRAQNARAQGQEQIKVLGILAGTLPAQGPGVRVTLTDPDGKVQASNLLDAIEELRDAGAEAIQINGKVRVVSSTAFIDNPPGVLVDGTKVESPYVIEAIGDSHNLSEAANFPGGLVSEITGPQINGTADVQDVQTLRVTALHTPREHRYARPAASPTK